MFLLRHGSMAIILTVTLVSFSSGSSVEDCFEEASSLHFSLLQKQVEVSAHVTAHTSKVNSTNVLVRAGLATESTTNATNAMGMALKGVAISFEVESRYLARKMSLSLGFSTRHIVHIVLGLLVAAGLVLLFLYYRAGYMLGDVIRGAIMTFDKQFLGVNVELGDVGLNFFTGTIDIEGFLLHNAPGYSAPYLMKARTVKLNIDMWLYIRSSGKRITVQEISVIDTHIFFEKSLRSSNVEAIQNHLKQKTDSLNRFKPPTADLSATLADTRERIFSGFRGDETPPPPKGCGAALLQCGTNSLNAIRSAPSSIQAAADRQSRSMEQMQNNMGNFKVHKVTIEEAGVIIEAKGMGNHGMHVSLADMNFPDLNEQVGDSVPMMVAFVLSTVLRSTLKSAYDDLRW